MQTTTTLAWLPPTPARSQAPSRTVRREGAPARPAGDRVTVGPPESRSRGSVPNFGGFWSGLAPNAPNRPLQYQADNAQQLRASRVPAQLSNHPGGPPAAPESSFRPDELGRDGRPRTGTIFNEVGRMPNGASRHHYVQIGALEPGLTREQAIRVANGFNAPTAGALQGRPNPMSLREGDVDPSAPAGGGLAGGTLGELGGHVSMNRGSTPDGLPWAINSTAPGRHPLNGHITRSLLEHEGRYYVRTEGVGTGNEFYSGAQDRFNQAIGPMTFDNLNQAANRFARSEFGLGTTGQAVRDRTWEAWQTVVRTATNPLGL